MQRTRFKVAFGTRGVPISLGTSQGALRLPVQLGYIVQARGEATDDLKPPILWLSIVFTHKAAPKAGFKLTPWAVQSTVSAG